MARRLLGVIVVALALVPAGCGGDEEPASSATAPPAPTPAPSVAATPTATVTATPTASASPTATETPTPENPEDQPGGAGDEEEVRVPVQFTLDDAGIDPPEVAVPAFLALELIVRNDGSEPVVARLEGAEPLHVAPGETGRARLVGRRAGRYRVDFGAAGEAVLVTGAEVGP
jgi:hypothetical protein